MEGVRKKAKTKPKSARAAKPKSPITQQSLGSQLGGIKIDTHDISFSAAEVRKAIILSEIIQPPVSKRRRHR